jgi:hypothetical protein
MNGPNKERLTNVQASPLTGDQRLLQDQQTSFEWALHDARRQKEIKRKSVACQVSPLGNTIAGAGHRIHKLRGIADKHFKGWQNTRANTSTMVQFT